MRAAESNWHLADDTFKCIFMNELNFNKISLNRFLRQPWLKKDKDILSWQVWFYAWWCQCGKLNFWSTRLKTDVLYMFHTKFHLARSIFYSPRSKCTCIGEQAHASFPHCDAICQSCQSFSKHDIDKVSPHYSVLHVYTVKKNQFYAPAWIQQG